LNRKEHLRIDQLSEIIQRSRRQIYRTMERVDVRGNTYFRVPQEVREMDPNDRLMKTKEVSILFSIHQTTAIRWFNEGKLRGVKLGEGNSCIRIFKSSVDKLLKESDNV